MRFVPAVRFAVPALLASVALTGCGGDETPGAGGDATTPATSQAVPTTTAPSPAPSSAPSTATTTPKPSPANTADVTVDVSIAGGKISTGGHNVVKAKSGQTLRINGTSDVVDSLHVHGYDKSLELKPGKPASLEFKTDTKGIFEVETHESGKLVFKLQVL